MVFHKCDAKLDERFEMRGGKGTVKLLMILPKEGLPNHTRLMAEIILEEGCSIGAHPHENECEIFYVTSGAGRYLDDGAWVDVTVGDVMTCGEGKVHSIENPNAEPLVVTAVIVQD